MEKIIKLSDKEVRLNNNAAWTMEYRDQFNKDILPVLLPTAATIMETFSTVIAGTGGELSLVKIAESLEGRAVDILLPITQLEFVDVAINITWAMAKAADENIKPPKQWIKEFETFPLDVVIPEAFKLALEGFVSSKNLERLGKAMKNLQPQLSMMLSSQESNEG